LDFLTRCQGHELRTLALDLLHDLEEVKLGPSKAIQPVGRDLISRSEVVEHALKFSSVPFGSGRLLPKDVGTLAGARRHRRDPECRARLTELPGPT
jgi:hypothetical protein